tara:strand:+ start:11639 stop:12598 length:960 start_codon:yes stop_codon:yes gene_type:complete
MNDLLKDAIADAKAVRETALANAKVALEEAFTPRLQSMLSARLSEEEGMDDEMDMEMPAEEPDMDMSMETIDDDNLPMEGDYSDDSKVDEDMEDPKNDDALELESIIAELEKEIETEELDSSDIGSTLGVSDDASETHTEDPGEGKLSEEENADMETEEMDPKDDNVSIDEIISALTEEEGDDKDTVKEEDEKEMTKEEEEGDKDLKEAYTVIKFLKSKINEVNLLNAKLLFSNKLFRNYPLNESQKMKVIENFDRASNLREVKLIFTTLSESFVGTKTKRSIKESYASKPSRSTAPKKEILSEGNQLAARWKKLANLK